MPVDVLMVCCESSDDLRFSSITVRIVGKTVLRVEDEVNVDALELDGDIGAEWRRNLPMPSGPVGSGSVRGKGTPSPCAHCG